MFYCNHCETKVVAKEMEFDEKDNLKPIILQNEHT